MSDKCCSIVIILERGERRRFLPGDTGEKCLACFCVSVIVERGSAGVVLLPTLMRGVRHSIFLVTSSK